MASVLCLSIPGEEANTTNAEPQSETSADNSPRNDADSQGVEASSPPPTIPAPIVNNTETPAGVHVELNEARSVLDELPLRPPQPPPITPQRRNRRGRAARASVSSITLTDPSALGCSDVPPEDLPDILHAHLPPPYSSLPLPTSAVVSPAEQCASSQIPSACVSQPLRNGALPGACFTENYSLIGLARRRRSVYGGGRSVCSDGRQKACCGGGGGCGLLLMTQAVSVRWFIVVIAFVGLSCAVVGTVLGTLRSAGRQNLTVALLMISVGIVLVTVSAVAWRLTAGEPTSCCRLLGLGGPARLEFDLEQGATRLPAAEVGAVLTSSGRRFAQRVVPGYGRPHHPYAAMVYPEFQFRPPPPSYHASMQAYRLGLLLDQHTANQQQQQQQGHNSPSTAGGGGGGAAVTLSPPPAYRAHGTLRFQRQLTLSALSERSQPPSYHSRQSSAITGDNNATCRQPRQPLVYQPPLDASTDTIAPPVSVADDAVSTCQRVEVMTSSVGDRAGEDTFGAIKSLRRKRRSKQPAREHDSGDVDVKTNQAMVVAPPSSSPPSLVLSVVPCVSVTATATTSTSTSPRGNSVSDGPCLVSVVHTEPEPADATLVLNVDAAASSVVPASQVQILAHL